MSNQSASRQFRERVGLPALDESETPIEEPTPEELEEGETEEESTEETEELDPDEDMGRGEPPEDLDRDEPFPGDNV